MKKILLVSLILLITGCGTKKMICQLDVDNDSQNYHLNGKYEISYQNNLVKSVKTTEEYTSNSSQMIDYFYKYLEKNSKDFNKNYGHISYSTTKQEGKLTYKSVVDYSEIDTKVLLEDNFINKENVKNNQIIISGLKDMYESKGANCK